jgi:hypothetical protein
VKIKAGNTIDLLFTINDSSGVPITNLNTATAIKFMVKTNPIDTDLAAKISKSLGNGVVINTPATGNVKVSLTSLETKLSTGKYFMGLQIEWGTVIQEVDIKETIDEVMTINTFDIVQDVIR